MLFTLLSIWFWGRYDVGNDSNLIDLSPYSYEPELFPGLIYRMIKPRIVLLIFVSGKVVLTGKSLTFITN